MRENIQTTQTKDKQYPKLYDSFFDKELDYKNDFVTYIDVTSNQHYNTTHIQHKAINMNSKIILKVKSLRSNLETVDNQIDVLLTDRINNQIEDKCTLSIEEKIDFLISKRNEILLKIEELEVKLNRNDITS